MKDAIKIYSRRLEIRLAGYTGSSNEPHLPNPYTSEDLLEYRKKIFADKLNRIGHRLMVLFMAIGWVALIVLIKFPS